MAVKIELKRSAIPGKVPSVDQLDLGELAINTYDGAVYLKQDTGVSQSIIQLASTAGSGSLVVSASHADYADNAGHALTADYATAAGTAISASHALYADQATSSSYSLSGSYALTASYALNVPVTGAYAISASHALFADTASSADDFFVRGNLTASNALFYGDITAQTLHIQYITSSQELITGSLTVEGGITGSLLGTASYAAEEIGRAHV